MGSMHTGLEEHPEGAHRLAQFYRERAENGVSLIITGGIAPNPAGTLTPHGASFTQGSQIAQHQIVTDAVHQAGGKIALQILHAGRYSFHPQLVAPSAIKADINPFTPHPLTDHEILQIIDDFAHTAQLSQRAGYDGIEIMGSEGYLINQFIAQRTNKREDKWGGSFAHRIAFPLEILRAIRQKTGNNFIIIYRLSMLDLVDEGSDWQQIVQLAQEIELAGASMINTGIGWHEARVPTIATQVPRAGFSWVTQKLMGKVSIPLITTNRINDPYVANALLAEQHADMVSMARPFLADEQFITKAQQDRADEINTCIGCNQACLDQIFAGEIASCLVNPRACHESDYLLKATTKIKNIAVVGAGPAGLSCAINSAKRGHKVTLFEQDMDIGGLFNLAKKIPGKEEFYETLRFFRRQLELQNIKIFCNHRAEVDDLLGFDEVVLATGVQPREIQLSGINHPKVVNYIDVLKYHHHIGQSAAIIGSGGIGFDVAEFLSHQTKGDSDINSFTKQWNIDTSLNTPGGLISPPKYPLPQARKLYLLQRKPSKNGANLAKTTGWIHRLTLHRRGIEMLNAVEYLKIDDQGLHIRRNGQTDCLEVDNVILCAGQEPYCPLYKSLEQRGISVSLIGGADIATELDARRAIKQGMDLAYKL